MIIVDDQRQPVHKQLRDYDSRFESLRSIIGLPQLSRIDVNAARSILKRLKDDLARDSMILAKVSTDLNHYEKTVLLPAITQAHSQLRVWANSHPRNANWHNDVTSAQEEIRHFLRPLERKAN